jgi:hypothetical protein
VIVGDAVAAPADRGHVADETRSSIPRVALEVLVAGALVGYPLVVSGSLLAGIPTRLPAIGVRAIVLAAAFFVIFGSSTNPRQRNDTRNWALLSFVSFWLLYLCRLFIDLGWLHVVADRPPLEYVSFALGVSCIPALAVIAARSNRIALPSDLWLFVLTSSTSVLSATAILFSVLRGTAVGDVNSGRLGIDILNPVTVGEISGISVALGARMLLIATNTPRQRLLIALASLASGVALLSTGARGPLIATVASVLILVSAHPMSRRRRIQVFAIAAILSSAVALMIPGLSSKFGLSIAERLAVLVSRGQEESVNGRLDRLVTAMSDFGRHPVLGSSITTSTTRDYPHNVIAEAFMATGLLGGGLLLAIVFASVSAARRRLRAPEGDSPVWPATIFPTVMLTALVSGSIAYSSVLWVTIASLIFLGSDRLVE